MTSSRATTASSLGGGARDAASLVASVAVLLSGAEPEAPLLLQALRWRLTKPARRQRRTALAQFAQNDLLEPRLLEALLGADAPPMVREQALRLVNLFASEVGRRSHLLSLLSTLPAGLTLTLLALTLKNSRTALP